MKYKVGDRVKIVPPDKDYCTKYAGTDFVRDIQNTLTLTCIVESPYSPEYNMGVRVDGRKEIYTWRVPESWLCPIEEQLLFPFMYEKV